MKIERVLGSVIKAKVDVFYERHGSDSRANPVDLFFLLQSGDRLNGCVRFCLEENTPMLRSMMVDAGLRNQGYGKRLLSAFVDYLDEVGIRGVYCLPYAHLRDFYKSAGFNEVSADETPPFLLERLAIYRAKGKQYLCMRRP